MNLAHRHWAHDREEGYRMSRGLGWFLLYTTTLILGIILTAILIRLT